MPKFIITLTGSRSFDFTTEIEAETEMDAVGIANDQYGGAEDDDSRFTWGDYDLDGGWEAEEVEEEE